MKNCYSCNTVKPLSAFNAHKNKADGRSSQCKSCCADYAKRYKAECVTWFREYRSTLSCEECGQNHPATLDFHHLDPSVKEGSVSRMVRDAYSMARIKAEIAKCIVVCSNCHRKLHWNERQEQSEQLIQETL